MSQGGTMPERKGRFKIKEVEVSDAEDGAGAEPAIVSGRIRGTEAEEGARSMSRHGSEASMSVSMGDSSDPHTLSKTSSCKELKKGRFIIRELPEGTTDASSPVPSHPGTPQAHTPNHHHHHHHHHSHHHSGSQGGMQPNPSSQHHVQIDPNIYLHQLPKQLGASSSKPPLHPPIHAPDTPSSLSDHMHTNPSSSQSLRQQEFIYYQTGTLSSAPSPLTGSLTNSSYHNEVLGFATTPGGGCGGDRLVLDVETARLLKHQNEQIISKLQQLEKAMAAPTPSGPGVEKRDGSAAGGAKSKDSGDALNRSDTSAGGSSGKDTTLGKLNYHLEQMKSEVEAATAKRKELDMQMKRLQERNRALEEKADEEKTKRIAAEKKVEKFKETVDHMATDIRHLQEQLAAYQQHQQQQHHQQQQQQHHQQQQQQQQQQHPPQSSTSAPPQPPSQPPPPPQAPSSSADFDFMHGHVVAPIPNKAQGADVNIEDLVSGPSSSVVSKSSAMAAPVRMASPAPPSLKQPTPQHGVGLDGGGSRPGAPSSSADPFNGLVSLSSNPGLNHGRQHSAPPSQDDAFSELVAQKRPPSASLPSTMKGASSSASSRPNLV